MDVGSIDLLQLVNRIRHSEGKMSTIFRIWSACYKELHPRELSATNDAKQLFQKFDSTYVFVKGIHDGDGGWYITAVAKVWPAVHTFTYASQRRKPLSLFPGWLLHETKGGGGHGIFLDQRQDIFIGYDEARLFSTYVQTCKSPVQCLRTWLYDCWMPDTKSVGNDRNR